MLYSAAYGQVSLHPRRSLFRNINTADGEAVGNAVEQVAGDYVPPDQDAMHVAEELARQGDASEIAALHRFLRGEAVSPPTEELRTSPRVSNEPKFPRSNGPELFDVRDERTGFRGKAALLSERSIAEINAAIPGPKILLFGDVKGMGPASKAGLDREIDALLASQPDIIRESFGDVQLVPLRPGGDEFAFILPDTPAARAGMQRYEAAMRERKAAAFEGHPDPVIREKTVEAQRVAGIRTAMRKLQADFKESLPKGAPFRLADYRDWLVRERGVTLPSGAKQLDLARQVGLLERVIVEGGTHTDEVMGMSWSAVKLPETMTTSDVARAMGEADIRVHADKKAGRMGNLEPVDVSATTLDKAGDIAERTAFARREREYRQLTEGAPDSSEALRAETRDRLRDVLFGDPAVAGVMRLDFVRSQSAAEIFKIVEPTRMRRVRVDVKGAGAINNNAGYTAFDQLFREITETIAARHPDAVKIRVNGGAQDIYLPEHATLAAATQDELRAKLTTFLREQPHADAVLAEATQRQALKELLDGIPLADTLYDVPLVDVVTDTSRVIEIHPSQTLDSLYTT